jgi:hypothetical protein
MALPVAPYRWRGRWVSGSDYFNYDAVQSPLTLLTYVLDNGNQLINSVIDPSASPLWKVLNPLVGGFTPAFGSFSSTQTQPFAVPPSGPTLLSYNTQDLVPQGVACILPSAQLTVAATGVYKVLSSIQMDNTAILARDAEAWIAVNGTPVPNSATRVQLSAAVEVVMAVEWFVPLSAGDTIEIQGAASGGAGPRALAIAAAGYIPAIPSIITTITRIA